MGDETASEVNRLEVEVAYATSDVQVVMPLELTAGATVGEAIRESGILHRLPEIDLGRNAVGIYGRLVGMDTPLESGDRVEIYRPLAVDPRERRRRRAASGSALRRRPRRGWK